MESLLSSWRIDPAPQFSGSARFFFYAHIHTFGEKTHFEHRAVVAFNYFFCAPPGRDGESAGVRAIFSCIRVSDGALNVVTSGYTGKVGHCYLLHMLKSNNAPYDCIGSS